MRTGIEGYDAAAEIENASPPGAQADIVPVALTFDIHHVGLPQTSAGHRKAAVAPVTEHKFAVVAALVADNWNLRSGGKDQVARVEVIITDSLIGLGENQRPPCIYGAAGLNNSSGGGGWILTCAN